MFQKVDLIHLSLLFHFHMPSHPKMVYKHLNYLASQIIFQFNHRIMNFPTFLYLDDETLWMSRHWKCPSLSVNINVKWYQMKWQFCIIHIHNHVSTWRNESNSIQLSQKALLKICHCLMIAILTLVINTYNITNSRSYSGTY